MNILPKSELDTLINITNAPCTSIYMPTHRSGPEAEQDIILFKNLVREAEQKLLAIGKKANDIKALLAPTQTLQVDSFFWRHQSDGLALFFAPNFFRYFRLPLFFKQTVIVSDHFYITPLLPLFIADGRFYILSLSKKHIRLFHCTRLSIREVELLKVPKSIDEIMKFSVPDKDFSCHAVGIKGSGGGTAIFHGHGSAPDAITRKKQILDFYQQVSKYLSKFLKGERAPIVMAGVDFQRALYREASSYPSLLPEGINGSPEGMTPEELHDKAWSLVEPYFKNALDTAIAQFRNATNTERVSTSLPDIVLAAYQGRIEILFVTSGIPQQWGHFDPNTGNVEIHPTRVNGDKGLQNLAAIYTLSKGGAVYVVESREAPVHAPLAALYRY